MKHLIVYFILLFVNISLQAHPGWGIAVDSKGNIYFPDITRNGGSIFRLDKDGKLQTLLTHIHAHSVHLDNQNNLYTAHGEEVHYMIRRTPDGQVDTLIKSKSIDQFFGGNSIWSPHYGIVYGLKKHKKLAAIQRDKTMFVSDHEFIWNQAIYADKEGNIYAPDIGIDNGILVRIDPNGCADIIARDLISTLSRPRDRHNDVLLGMAKGPDGKMYIAELAGQRIIQINDDGTHNTFYKSAGNWFPTAIAFDGNEAVVMEYRHSSEGMKGPRIIRINSKGRATLLYDRS